MTNKPSTAPTCTVIARSWVIWNEAGEVGWESMRSGESGWSGRQVGDKTSARCLDKNVVVLAESGRQARYPVPQSYERRSALGWATAGDKSIRPPTRVVTGRAKQR
jgi:hypothetical protein